LERAGAALEILRGTKQENDRLKKELQQSKDDVAKLRLDLEESRKAAQTSEDGLKANFKKSQEKVQAVEHENAQLRLNLKEEEGRFTQEVKEALETINGYEAMSVEVQEESKMDTARRQRLGEELEAEKTRRRSAEEKLKSERNLHERTLQAGKKLQSDLQAIKI
jgi:chromosome segregation ATPase